MANAFQLLLPPWRLGSNVRSASSEAVEGLSDGAIGAEWAFALAVIIGVIVELRHPVIGDWMVVGGVAGELLASMTAHLCQSELSRRSNAKLEDAHTLAMLADGRAARASSQAGQAMQELGKANERAAKLEKEAAEIRAFAAYRHIPPDKLQQIVEPLRTMAPSLIIYIEWERSDTEALWYATEIADVFRRAGTNSMAGMPNSFVDREVFGVWVSAAPGVDANAIWSAFHDAGVSLGTEIWNGLRLMPMQPPANVRIFVGHKQPPASPVFAAPA